MNHNRFESFDGVGVIVDHFQFVAETTQNAFHLEENAVLGMKFQLGCSFLSRHVRVVVVAEIDAGYERSDGLAE